MTTVLADLLLVSMALGQDAIAVILSGRGRGDAVDETLPVGQLGARITELVRPPVT